MIPAKMRPDDDDLVRELRSVWLAAQSDLAEAISTLSELDNTIRAAARDGMDGGAIAIQGGIELNLVLHVGKGGSSLSYLLEKSRRLATD